DLRQVGGHSSTQRDALRPCLSLDSPQGFVEDLRNVHGLEIEPKLASFDTGQIEELVNGLSQLLDAHQRRRNELALPFWKYVRSFLQHQQRHSERGERRLQLMR